MLHRLEKILTPIALLALLVAYIVAMTGCDVTEPSSARTMSIIDSGTVAEDSQALAIPARSWSVCAAGQAPEPNCPSCTQYPFSWSYEAQTSRRDTIRVRGRGDTCMPAGTLDDTLQIKTLAIGRVGHLDSIWFESEGDSAHYEAIWPIHQMAPELFRRAIDSIEAGF